jgi:hypothetical protein
VVRLWPAQGSSIVLVRAEVNFPIPDGPCPLVGAMVNSPCQYVLVHGFANRESGAGSRPAPWPEGWSRFRNRSLDASSGAGLNRRA